MFRELPQPSGPVVVLVLNDGGLAYRLLAMPCGDVPILITTKLLACSIMSYRLLLSSNTSLSPPSPSCAPFHFVCQCHSCSPACCQCWFMLRSKSRLDALTRPSTHWLPPKPACPGRRYSNNASTSSLSAIYDGLNVQATQGPSCLSSRSFNTSPYVNTQVHRGFSIHLLQQD